MSSQRNLQDWVTQIGINVSTVNGDIASFLQERRKVDTMPEDVDLGLLLTLQLFEGLTPSSLRATQQFLKMVQQDHGSIFAVRHPIARSQLIIGTLGGIDLEQSHNMHIVLKVRETNVIVIDHIGSDFHIAVKPLQEYQNQISFQVYFNGESLNTYEGDFFIHSSYHRLVEWHRLFLIAAHLLNAAEQVNSDLLRNALYKALEAAKNLATYEETLVVGNQLIALFATDHGTLYDKKGHVLESLREDIRIYEEKIAKIKSEYPELPLLK